VGGEDAPALKALGTPGRHLAARIRELDTSAWIDFGLLGLKTIVGFCCLFAVIGWYIPSSGAFIFKYCVPFAWLVLVQPPDETARQTRGGRIALCLITVFVYLYAYPVAGTQAVFASVPAGILAIVLLRDAMLGIAALFPVGFIRRRAFQFAPALASALIVILFSGELRDAY
jgi:hypothetical protein